MDKAVLFIRASAGHGEQARRFVEHQKVRVFIQTVGAWRREQNANEEKKLGGQKAVDGLAQLIHIIGLVDQCQRTGFQCLCFQLGTDVTGGQGHR